MAKSSSSDASLDSCITCSSKYNRVRPSLCQCKHCSNSFCFDCMKNHNDELQQNIAQVSNRYNELKLLINNQRKLITEETIKSKDQMSAWLGKYIDNLIAEKAKIDTDIEETEKDAQKFVNDIEAQLHTFSADIEGFTKNSTFQSSHMEKLVEKLDELIQQLSPLEAMREYDLPSTMPKYKFEFNHSPQSTTDDIRQTLKILGKQDIEKSKTTEQPKVEEQNRSDSRTSDTQTFEDEGINPSFPDENYFCNRNRYEPTSYSINCMASDGRNIMYSTIEDPKYDIIAYCYLDVKSGNYRQIDPCRPWLLSRIVDMIWWNSIDKFVCATENGILTVEYINTRFKILTVINDRWSDVRVAANTNSIWVHVNGEFMVYDINFMLVRSMNFEIPCIITRESFCITDNLVAFVVIRGDRTRSDILQVQFYDFNMIRMRSFDLGLGKIPCMIRTDGTDRFFIAGGKPMFYILSSKDYKRTIDLGKEASCLTVVNRGSIVLTKSRSELELVKC